MDLLHLCLNVADADRAANWYVEQLGFERSWEFTTEDGATRNVYVTADNGIEIQLAETEGQEIESGTGWDHVAVSTDDVDRAFEETDHFGVVRVPTDHPAAGTRTAFVEDPDGHHVEFVQPLE